MTREEYLINYRLTHRDHYIENKDKEELLEIEQLEIDTIKTHNFYIDLKINPVKIVKDGFTQK